MVVVVAVDVEFACAVVVVLVCVGGLAAVDVEVVVRLLFIFVKFVNKVAPVKVVPMPAAVVVVVALLANVVGITTTKFDSNSEGVAEGKEGDIGTTINKINIIMITITRINDLTQILFIFKNLS